MNRKVVYNACYGGFSLSIKGLKRLYELKWPEKTLHVYNRDKDTYTKMENPKDVLFSTYVLETDMGESFTLGYRYSETYKKFEENLVYDQYRELPRHDPDLVRVVEDLGEEASGPCSNLKVADIGESKYHIDEYDGYESVITQHAENYWL